tara:strand:- start:18 stop:323 length:306 start_codon:yes stop_codon:yes gene_type:complete
MLFWIIQQTIISIILIISVHYIYIFFKNNLTIPKTKDLVNKPTEQYKQIYNSIKTNKETSQEMKKELKNYLKTLHSKKKNNAKTSMETTGNIFSNSNFTSY